MQEIQKWFEENPKEMIRFCRNCCADSVVEPICRQKEKNVACKYKGYGFLSKYFNF